LVLGLTGVSVLWARSYWGNDVWYWLTTRRDGDSVGMKSFTIISQRGRIRLYRNWNDARADSMWAAELVEYAEKNGWGGKNGEWTFQPERNSNVCFPASPEKWWKPATVFLDVEDGQQWEVNVAHWLVAGMLALGPGAWGVVWWRRSRVSEGCCVKCGYDLRASEGRCPECGEMQKSELRIQNSESA
jgi:hypothetical protein